MNGNKMQCRQQTLPHPMLPYHTHAWSESITADEVRPTEISTCVMMWQCNQFSDVYITTLDQELRNRECVVVTFAQGVAIAVITSVVHYYILRAGLLLLPASSTHKDKLAAGMGLSSVPAQSQILPLHVHKSKQFSIAHHCFLSNADCKDESDHFCMFSSDFVWLELCTPYCLHVY